MSEASALAALAAHWKRRGGIPFDPAEVSFGPQTQAIVSTAVRKVLCCGRRAGKTLGVAIALLLAARAGPAVPVLYLTLTRGNAKEILWDDLCALNTRYGLGGMEHLSDLELRFPGGGVIQLRGAHTEREIAKYRGKKFKLVVVDEMQDFPERVIVPLLQKVIGPTLIDYGGSLWLSGTRSYVRAGFWWECYSGKLAQGREQHAWTVRDNVRLPARMAGADIEAILRMVREEYGWTDDNPTYQREYLNLDVEDLNALLYEYDPVRNAAEYPANDGQWQTMLAIDEGFEDERAFAVCGWRPHEQRVVSLHQSLVRHEDITDLAEKAAPLIQAWKPLRIGVDYGSGKAMAAELQRRHGIPVEPVPKTDKPTWIKLFNGAMRTGMFVAPADSPFASDCKLVRKDLKVLAQEKTLREDPNGYHSNICDAMLYSWRMCFAYLEERAAPTKPAPGTPERAEVDADALMTARVDEMRRRQADDPWQEFD